MSLKIDKSVPGKAKVEYVYSMAIDLSPFLGMRKRVRGDGSVTEEPTHTPEQIDRALLQIMFKDFYAKYKALGPNLDEIKRAEELIRDRMKMNDRHGKETTILGTVASGKELTSLALSGPLISGPYSYITAGSANQDSQLVKASSGVLQSLVALCPVSTPRYLKIYDQNTPPTFANTPTLRLPIPANSTSIGGFVFPLPSGGLPFNNGFSFRVTQNLADNDQTACAAGDAVINAVFQ